MEYVPDDLLDDYCDDEEFPCEWCGAEADEECYWDCPTQQ